VGPPLCEVCGKEMKPLFQVEFYCGKCDGVPVAVEPEKTEPYNVTWPVWGGTFQVP
jgi:tRNA(Ile2) C34 agmatinyltransferase TiaS